MGDQKQVEKQGREITCRREVSFLTIMFRHYGIKMLKGSVSKPRLTVFR